MRGFRSIGRRKPGIDRGSYRKVIIEPITVFVSPDSEYKGLEAADLQAIADGFREAMSKALAPDVAVVTEHGPGVLRMRAALSNVMLKKAKRGLLGYTPVGIVVTVAQHAAGSRISLKNAVLEVETLDAASGERLGVLVDTAPKMAEDKDLSWQAIEITFAFYGERIKMHVQLAPQ